MYNRGKGIYKLSVYQYIEFYQVGLLIFPHLIIHGAISLGNAFELIIKIHQYLIERELGAQHYTGGVYGFDGICIVATIVGSSIFSIVDGSGIFTGLSISMTFPVVSVIL